MITQKQVRKLMKEKNLGNNLEVSAMKSGMSIPTARKYLRLNGKVEPMSPRTWRTRPDPFADIWKEAEELFENNQGLEALTVFEHLQRKYPGQFTDGQLRTFQRRVKEWRIFYGKEREVFFEQLHHPGRLCESDFTRMNGLGVTIGGQPFDHMLYHFVLTYSNWETGTVCFAESFDSLSEGIQNALWELGSVPKRHRTDCLSTAVNNLISPKEFTRRYRSLLEYYGLELHRTQPASPNENGDVEQRHHRFKRALDQALMLRGSRDFTTREEYQQFLRSLFAQLNANRREKLAEEIRNMAELPECRLDTRRTYRIRVGRGSTIRVLQNTYSVDSRLIGQHVEVLASSETLEVRYGGRLIEAMPRLHGKNRHRIEYRHIIKSLVRKPGAFADYRYRNDLFPTSHFRVAYDTLRRQRSSRADKEYLRLLELAADTSEQAVNSALQTLLAKGQTPSLEGVEHLLEIGKDTDSTPSCRVDAVYLADYDELFETREVEA